MDLCTRRPPACQTRSAHGVFHHVCISKHRIPAPTCCPSSSVIHVTAGGGLPYTAHGTAAPTVLAITTRSGGSARKMGPRRPSPLSSAAVPETRDNQELEKKEDIYYLIWHKYGVNVNRFCLWENKTNL